MRNKMPEYSSRKDKLWYVARQLVEEEAKLIQIAQLEEEHVQRIQSKYNQLVSNLSCLGDVIAMMYEREKLTLKELEHIQHLQSTPIRANEELLSIIARKPRDVYECFLSVIKQTNQPHLYQMLVSNDDSCDKATRGDTMDHRDLICRNFMWLSEDMYTENGLISVLFKRNVLTVREKERISCMSDIFEKNEQLLGLLSKKSPRDYENFLEALEESSQGHLADKLRNPGDVSTESVTSVVQTPMTIFKELLPKVFHEPLQIPKVLPLASKKVVPPKTLPKPGQKLVQSNSLLKPIPPPKPDTRSTAFEHDAIQVVSKNTEKTIIKRRGEVVTLQSRLKGLESHLKTEISIKVTSVSQLYLDKPADKTCFQILLQECHRMRKETIAKAVESNMELEQLRESVSQYSAAASLNEVYQKQLHSMQQELITERCQYNKERMRLEDNIDKLKADIHNEKVKCKRFDEDRLLNNTVITKLEERLKRAECDKQFFQQQMHELIAHLATCKYELEMSKDTIKKFYDDTISLRNENDKLKKACERLSKTNETITDAISESNVELNLLRTERDKLKEVCDIPSKEDEIGNEFQIPLHNAHETSRDLLGRLKEKEMNLEVDDEETFDRFKNPEGTSDEIFLASNRILNLEKELECVGIEEHDCKEDKLTYATTQQEQFDAKPEGMEITSISHECKAIRNNHQFLLENIEPSRFIDLLHEQDCITDKEQYYLSNQPNNFYKNDALLHWMRTVAFKQDIGLKVLECLSQSKQPFVVDLLSKGGVLIKSKIMTNLVKERSQLKLFVKSSSDNADALKQKEVMLIEELNKRQGLSLFFSQDVTSELGDDEIIIGPYCHQEDHGIVVWFWCLSNNAQRNLQSMYSSNVLLEKLLKIFKQFSTGSMSSGSQRLVPTGITIYADDFMKNKKIVDFTSDPKLLLTITGNAEEKSNDGIYALAVLANEIFVIARIGSKVKVYNRTSLQFQRKFTVDNLEEPRDIVSCARNNCLYIIDGKAFGQPMEILKVDKNGNILKKVWRDSDWGRLSVTSESNLILAVLDKRKLLEITPDGELVHEVRLDVDRSHPWHAMKLTSDRFVVVYGRWSLGGICMVDSKGKVLMSASREALGASVRLLINVAINRDGSFLVVDEDGGRIILLSSTLEYERELISRKNGLRQPRRLFVDELNGRLLVCDNSQHIGRILVFDIAG